MRSGGRGSVVLLLLVALVLLRPWESVEGFWQKQPPRSALVQVTRVVDGDTVEVQIEGREEDVRYIGVDTPETVKPGEPVDCFGPQASSFNHRMVEGREVRLVFDRERRDDYDRLLAYVYLGDRFVNAELVRRGFAETLTIPPNDRFAERLKRLEIAAARAGRGLWGAC
jgi:micrococcal nuclease